MKFFKTSTVNINLRNSIYRRDFILLLLFFITSLCLLIYPDGSIRYFLNILLLFIVSVIFFLAPIRNKATVWYLATTLYLLFICSSLLVNDNMRINVTVINSFYAFYLMGYVLVFSNSSKRYMHFLYWFYFLLTAVISIVLISGFDPSNIFAGSRNSIGLLLVPLGAMFLIDGRLELNNKRTLLLYFLVLIACILAQGRSGILTSLILLLSYNFIFLRNVTYKKIFIYSVGIIFFISLLALYAQSIYNLEYFDYLKDRGLEDTYRADMRNEYLSSISFSNVMFGTNLKELPIISSFNGNPHNTYIHLHSSLGIITVITVALTLIYWLRCLITRNLVSYLAVTAILLRLGTDSSSSIAILPLLFTSLLLFKKPISNF